MSWSTREQLQAHIAALRKPALDREDGVLGERYAGQYVAYTDDWGEGYELVRTVLAATPDLAEFQRLEAVINPNGSWRIKSVAVPPAEPLPEPPPKERGATAEQLQALCAKTPAQKEALRAADYALCDDYPGQEVAFLDTWNGDELVRTILIATADGAEFSRRLNALPPDVLRRVRATQLPEPGVIDIGGADFFA